MVRWKYDDLNEDLESFYQEHDENLRQIRILALFHKLQGHFRGRYQAELRERINAGIYLGHAKTSTGEE